jgi:hypothetical protein
VAPQPLARRQPEGEGEQAGGAGRPEGTGEREAESRKGGENGRQPEHAERHRPREEVGLDQEGGAEPPEPGHEKAEAPGPAEERGGPQGRRRRAALGEGAVEKPDGDGERDGERRQRSERRHGERADGAGAEGEKPAPPAPGAGNPVDERRHDRGRTSGGGAAGSGWA